MIKSKTLAWNFERDSEGHPLWVAHSPPFVFRINPLWATYPWWAIALIQYRKTEFRLVVINRETQLLYYEIFPSFAACKWRAAQVAWQGSF